MRNDDWLEIDTVTNKGPFLYPRYDAAPVQCNPSQVGNRTSYFQDNNILEYSVWEWNFGQGDAVAHLDILFGR